MKEKYRTYTIEVGNGDPVCSDDPFYISSEEAVLELQNEAVLELQNTLLEAIREDMKALREKGRTTTLQDFSFKAY